MIQAGYVRTTERRPARTLAPASPSPEPEVLARIGGGYCNQQRRPRWEAMAAILAVHVAALFLLAYFDVIQLTPKAKARLTVVEIQPEPVVPDTPPPAAAKVPPPPAEQPIVAPPPVIQTAIAMPSPVATTPIPSPPTPPIVSAAPPSAVVSETAAPISAPDGSAKSLGNPSPRYPMDARRNRWEGTVRLRVVITPEGMVKDIGVARSSGFDSLDEAALKTVAKWKFVPGKQAGVAVEAVGFLNIPFRLT
ncbi:TonB family protein [Sphingomonas sp. BIUV-7]|uniref:Protein TonB n=1 Tax=Sphingomonas natans TaxID=3063330 RepID=A0ABT8YED1_9SPHN|nr:energy transducer TonB [Sphingomonas sp. BIUV-7]MDO6416736.1 TonB family protein [Sphingomonas sp. BIUV-7]